MINLVRLQIKQFIIFAYCSLQAMVNWIRTLCFDTPFKQHGLERVIKNKTWVLKTKRQYFCTPKNIFKLTGKKISTILGSKFCLF